MVTLNVNKVGTLGLESRLQPADKKLPKNIRDGVAVQTTGTLGGYGVEVLLNNGEKDSSVFLNVNSLAKYLGETAEDVRATDSKVLGQKIVKVITNAAAQYNKHLNALVVKADEMSSNRTESVETKVANAIAQKKAGQVTVAAPSRLANIKAAVISSANSARNAVSSLAVATRASAERAVQAGGQVAVQARPDLRTVAKTVAGLVTAVATVAVPVIIANSFPVAQVAEEVVVAPTTPVVGSEANFTVITTAALVLVAALGLIMHECCKK